MFRPPAGRSQLLGAVGAVDVVRVEHEALVGQAEAALLAVEAVLVPGKALVVHHVGAMTEPCSGTRGGRGRTRGGVGGRDTHGGCTSFFSSHNFPGGIERAVVRTRRRGLGRPSAQNSGGNNNNLSAVDEAGRREPGGGGRGHPVGGRNFL